MLVTGQSDLTHPVLSRHHPEMSDGDSQVRTLLDDLLHLSHLGVAVSQFDTEQDAPLFHQVHHLHHLVVEELFRQSGGRHLDALETLHQSVSHTQETGLTVIGHPKTEKTIGVLPLHLGKIVVLQTIDKFLCHHCCRHLGIIHVREEPLRRILSVSHKGR